MLYLVGPFYFEGALGMDPLGVGLVFLVIPIIIIVGSPVAVSSMTGGTSGYCRHGGLAWPGFRSFSWASPSSRGI